VSWCVKAPGSPKPAPSVAQWSRLCLLPQICQGRRSAELRTPKRSQNLVPEAPRTRPQRLSLGSLGARRRVSTRGEPTVCAGAWGARAAPGGHARHSHRLGQLGWLWRTSLDPGASTRLLHLAESGVTCVHQNYCRQHLLGVTVPCSGSVYINPHSNPTATVL
jgi:hypothetical protein